MLAMRAESRRLIWPAPTPMVMPSAQNTIALLLTYFATFQANSRSCSCCGVGCFLLTTLRSARTSSWLSAVWIKRPEPTRLTSIALRPLSQSVAPPWGSAISSTRTLSLALVAWNTSSASGV
ncbi:hypothetical protein D3C72_1434970 [compost metagenome]